MKTLLITGATGGVGTMLRRELAGRYRLRLSDLRPIKTLAPGESFAKADVASLNDALRISRGVDAILHLGAHSVEGDWKTILNANIIGGYNLFEAARRNKVPRMIFATSNHAVGFYRRDQTIDHTVYPKPDGRYGVSKVFGEALASLYADKYGLRCLCIRIGNAGPVPIDKRRLSLWISPRDLAQLVTIGIEHPDLAFEIVYGVSANTRSWYDNRNAYRLGYRPQDNSEPYAAELLKAHRPSDARAELYQGGAFVVAEEIENPAPLPRKTARKAASGPGRKSISKTTPKRSAKPAPRRAATRKAAVKKAPSRKSTTTKRGRTSR